MPGFLSDLFDPTALFSGGGLGDAANSLLDPLGASLTNFGVDIPGYSNVETPIANFGNNVGDTGLDEGTNLLNHFKNNPGQLLYSGADPVSTGFWNFATGQHNTPFLNQFGGETNKDYQNSESRGINTEDGQDVGTLANMIAGAYGGSALGNLAGGAAGVGSTTSAGSSALSDAAGETAGGGYGSSQAALDASQIPGWSSGGGGALGSGIRNGVSGAAQGGANALNNGTNPFQGAGMGALSAVPGALNSVDYSGALGIDNPLYKGALNGAVNGGIKSGMSGQNSLYGSLLGLLGGAGNAAANNSGYSTVNYGSGSSGGMGSLGNLGTMAAGLGQLFLGNKANQGVNSQISNLNSLYAPNSPYAQQMQQSLERQDAASGRRSQYGTRDVELQAALANAASRNAPQLSNLYQQQAQNRFGMAAGLLGSAKGAGVLGNSQNPLSSMFGGQQGSGQSFNISQPNYGGGATQGSQYLTGMQQPDPFMGGNIGGAGGGDNNYLQGMFGGPG